MSDLFLHWSDKRLKKKEEEEENKVNQEEDFGKKTASGEIQQRKK